MRFSGFQEIVYIPPHGSLLDVRMIFTQFDGNPKPYSLYWNPWIVILPFPVTFELVESINDGHDTPQGECAVRGIKLPQSPRSHRHLIFNC